MNSPNLSNTVVVPMFYLPPIQYFVNIIGCQDILIEKHEHYIKQTYRNRCNILGANGILPLTVPIEHTGNEHIKVKDVKISYNGNWQKVHWKSIESAYRSSPYFEYYEDDFNKIFNRKYEFLFDLNEALLMIVIEKININLNYTYTKSFIQDYKDGFTDLRLIMHPKKKKAANDSSFNSQPYIQVFSDKYSFIPNLSIIDLLFNIGTETLSYLKNCVSVENTE